jgi:hypothetical protein
MGPIIMGFTLVSGAWMLTIWRLVVEARKSWEVSDD